MVICTTVRIRNCSEFRIAHDLWVNTDSNVFSKVLRDLVYICVVWGAGVYEGIHARNWHWISVPVTLHPSFLKTIFFENFTHYAIYFGQMHHPLPKHPHLHPSFQLYSLCLPFLYPLNPIFAAQNGGATYQSMINLSGTIHLNKTPH